MFSRARSQFIIAIRDATMPPPERRVRPHSTLLRMTSSFSPARSVGSGGLSGACGAVRASVVVRFGPKIKLFP
ncbi:hypothetical protein SRABI128_06391 [Microbacterium sp. Bi128]|nr:hypothetical protein SRABI128_06391 [Microbacterium sp. Bi128]